MAEFNSSAEAVIDDSRRYDTDPNTEQISSWQMLGSGSASNQQVIKQNLKIVSFICNIFTIGMCAILLYNLCGSIRSSKSNSQKRKIPVLTWSMYFILCFSINTVLLVFVPFIPSAYPVCDLTQQLVILITVWVFFKFWEQNVSLFVRNRFVLMLTSKSASNRLTFMARVMNLAKGIMKNCKDEASADEFVQKCQSMCDSVYERGSELTKGQEDELADTIYRAMLYKVGKIDNSLCNCCCINDFSKKGPDHAYKIYSRSKFFIIANLVFNFLVQIALTVMDQRFEGRLYVGMPVSEILDHRNNVDFPLMSVQVVAGFFNIFQILVIVQFMQVIARKDDPFLNGHLICIQIFFVTIQRIIFTSFLGPSLDTVIDSASQTVSDPQDAFDILQIARYATMAMEFLFILLPLRHNFVSHNIEL